MDLVLNRRHNGKVIDPDTPKGRTLVHFGVLCCNQGKVERISDYALPHNLEMLYTSDGQVAVDFRKDARTYNNAMAMCSVTAKRGWRSRAHNNKMDSMLTAGGQLLQRAGPLTGVLLRSHICDHFFLILTYLW